MAADWDLKPPPSRTLPEGYDEMYERQPPVIESMSIYQSGGYHIELRYDFQDSGYGQRSWLGFHDGHDILFFSKRHARGQRCLVGGLVHREPAPRYRPPIRVCPGAARNRDRIAGR